MEARGHVVLALLIGGLVLAGCGGGSGGSSSSSSSSAAGKAKASSAVVACLNKAFNSGNVETDTAPVNPPELLQLYAAAHQHDVAVQLSNGGSAYVFVLPSAASAAKANPDAAHLVVADNVVVAYVHSPPPANAPPAQQKKALPLIRAPAKDAALMHGCI